MAQRLMILEEMYTDASPLTHLPGGIAIENVLKKRIETGDPLSFCLLDLDHFKALNDFYGYAQGNIVIITAANIIEDSVKKFGDSNDFVGHIGGDDFVVMTTPARQFPLNGTALISLCTTPPPLATKPPHPSTKEK